LPKVSAPPILSRRNSFWTSWVHRVVTEPQATTIGESAISFGPYRLLAARRLLLEGDKSVRLGGRAFDVLTALVERAGEVVGKEELIARAWPTTFVDEANLKIQVSALRRALGDGQGDNRYVVNVVGRGYNFVAPIRREEPSRASPSPTIAPSAPHNLPFATTRMIGREEIATTLVTQLSRQRLVTVVGPGGIGKTTVGLAVAERMIGAYEHGVWMVDLAPLADPRFVPSAVATALGLDLRTEDPLPGLVAALRDNRVLLLLDNCEHVIDAAARLAAALLGAAPGVNILATSREPLGLQGERVHRLGPLHSPGPSPGLTAAEAAAFPAVQLFVERVTAIVEDFALTDANAALVVAICRRLDGLPLAIEFAAPRVEVLGVEGLAARLDDGLRRLSGVQRRGALPRHRTMRAVVDWSYGLLSEDEQGFFCALGIFAGGFTGEAAAAAAMDAATTGVNVLDCLSGLVAKSLVVADVSGAKPRFRLLDTTRAYALEMLGMSGERKAIARRHAEYYRDLFERAEQEVPARPTGEWLADYAGEIDNLRAALDWAFSPSGVESIAVALAVAAIPLWLQLPMVDECRSRVEQVFASLAGQAPIDARGEMKLQAALGASLLFTKGAIPTARQASTAALSLAEALGDIEHQLRALWELWVHHTNTGELAAAFAVAHRFHTLALEHADPATLPIADRMMGMSYHYLGDQTNAWRYIERMLSADVDPQRHFPLFRFWFDQKVAGRVVLARILWLRGFPDQAWRTVQSAIADAEALADAATLCYALCHGGCLVALWVGNLAAAERYAQMLLDHSRKHGFAVWNDFASRLKGVVLVKTGDLDGGSQLLRAGLYDITEPNSGLWFLTTLSQMAEALGHAGRVADGLATVERGIERSQCGWLTPELLRIKGELLLSQGTTGTTETVEDVFRQALNWAREHGSLSWELRAATSLARLLHDQGRPADATACLQPIYDRFTEGFGSADLIAAKQLLDHLGTPDHD
jgi:predicted ATPase/DNA-binding winged helix-turn-helix (wHTH) protein